MTTFIVSAAIVAVTGGALWAFTGTAPGWAWTAATAAGLVLGSIPELFASKETTQ